MQVELHDTGAIEKLTGFKNETPKFEGKHLWVMMMTYRVDPKKLQGGEAAIMDHDTLLTMSGPGCYFCGNPHDPALANSPCVPFMPDML